MKILLCFVINCDIMGASSNHLLKIKEGNDFMTQHTKQTELSARWWILAAGVATMLFAGILYAWSILKAPFASELNYEASALALNFTLTMCFFCLGGFLSGQMVRRIGTRLTIIISGLMAGIGFVLTGFLGAVNPLLLYLTYAFLGGSGIGIAYIVIISTVNAWFPDRRGFSSGALMMGFGASTLILGNLADRLFASSLGWRNTYIIIGIAIAAAVMLSSFVIKAPDKDIVFPEKKKTAKVKVRLKKKNKKRMKRKKKVKKTKVKKRKNPMKKNLMMNLKMNLMMMKKLKTFQRTH